MKPETIIPFIMAVVTAIAVLACGYQMLQDSTKFLEQANAFCAANGFPGGLSGEVMDTLTCQNDSTHRRFCATEDVVGGYAWCQ